MQNVVEINLISNSTAGIKPKTFKAQTVEITHEPDVVLTGVDGRESPGSQPSTIRWFGGTARDFKGITDVRIVDNRGAVLVNGRLNTFYGVPRESNGWVIFDVLKPE
jgi:hypothetical protein